MEKINQCWYAFCHFSRTEMSLPACDDKGLNSIEFQQNVQQGFQHSTLHSVVLNALLKITLNSQLKFNWIGPQGTLDAVLGQYLQLDLDASTPDLDPVLSDVQFRTKLIKSLFYKGVLSVLGDSLPPEMQSGGSQITRGISSGQQGRNSIDQLTY